MKKSLSVAGPVTSSFVLWLKMQEIRILKGSLLFGNITAEEYLYSESYPQDARIIYLV